MTVRNAFIVAIAACVLALPVAGIVHADDPVPAFSKTSNPSGPWTYGYTTTRGGLLAVFAAHGTDGAGFDYWTAGAGQAQIAHNPGAGKLVGGTTYTPSNGLNLTAGNDGTWAVLRWTAPAAGTYAINAHFAPRLLSNAANGVAEVALLHAGAVVFDRWVAAQLGLSTASVAATLTLGAGETIDFAVGQGDESGGNDVVGLDATIDVVLPPPSAAGPVITLGGQRFAAARWDKAFESIAYDPINTRLAASGFLRDRCGNTISAGPDEQPGLAWDSKTTSYWQITSDRVVRRWSAAGAVLDTVFTIPLTFSVPTTGLDTLESVRGIATDSSNVYVVDAGPLPGTAPSNEWFKFSRTGSPLKSSKSTDFDAHFGADVDALADDICYVPFSSPVFPGRLLVALEHTGIEVLDVNGNHVASFRWTDQGFSKRPLAAFTGIAVDPASGNFYLVDNDQSAAMVLTRIVPQGASSYMLGGVGTINTLSGSKETAVLKYPNPSCDLPLWHAWGTYPTIPSNFFGYAYRPVDRAVYMCEFGTGDMWRFDPRLGDIQRVGPTGVGGWGLAYDSDRDVLYGMTGIGRVVVIDPASGAGSTLPNPSGFNVTGNGDIAWDSGDKKLYAVDFASVPNRLIRIDRDTGIGVVVSNITNVRGGLEFDASIGKLVSISGTGNQLIAIDPATGATSVLGALPAANGFEGLAIVPIPANTTPVAVESARPMPSDEVIAYPNPSRGSADLAFEIPVPQSVSVGVYDVTGRRVRQLASSRLLVGAQRLRWDGRDDEGHPSASGVYFARIDNGSSTRIARIVLAR